MKVNCCVLLLLASLALGGTASGQISGGIFTTDGNCDGTNLNVYHAKNQVYLDGGPKKEGSAGLPDGSYYVKVTEPDGALLGTSIHGASGDTPVHVTNGSFDTCYNLWDILVKNSNGKTGYDTSTNGGNEYKVWVSQDENFTNSLSKTDNFKVIGGNKEYTSIYVHKFYDYNGDGAQGDQSVEPSLPNWHIELQLEDGTVVGCELTDGGGDAMFIVLADGTNYVVKETLVDPYINTTPVAVPLTAASGTPARYVTFGNVCLVSKTGLGRTPGFWQSCNSGTGVVGCDLLEKCDPDWRKLLNDLCLVNPDGTDLVIPTGGDFEVAFDALGEWIVGNGADGNMAYILSRQLAAIALNRECGFLAKSGLVYIPCDGKMLNLDDVIDDASLLLCLFPETYGNSDDPDVLKARAEQEDIKNCLDAVNNNDVPVWIVSPTPCAFTPIPCE